MKDTIVWHKVADGDLPKDARYVWTNVGAGYHDDDGWWDDFGRLQNVIAWCEPKFEEGTEFGYNKANEWHYPSKGEYPKECENVLCCCKVVNAKFYSIGHTVIGGDTKIRWWASNRPEELEVYAWREIVFPEEVKENEN